jgi:hypothetical protein
VDNQDDQIMNDDEEEQAESKSELEPNDDAEEIHVS